MFSMISLLADRISDNAAPGGRVSPGALRQRVLNAEGSICRKPTNKPESAPAGKLNRQMATDAKQFAVGYPIDSR
jgi:hypothetical protein